ncbi:MAG: LamG domain-containing protein [Candidatus Gracilibacteria bacterium]|nr:LamG domain-containing protein [Candidatus Gracilibacteria bacterium]
MRKNISGFTLIEVIVVIAIISILSTVSFISFQGNLVNSRDTTRKADMANIKVALTSSKQKTGSFPYPSENFSIMNSGSLNIEAYQGILDENVSLNTIKEIPKDPRINIYYPYSIVKNKQDFQIGMTLENNGKNIAYVDGTYKTVAKNVFPSLLLAVSGSGQQFEIHELVGSGSDNRQKFILDGGSYNIPYEFENKLPVANGTSIGFSGMINEAGINIPTNTTYSSCAEIYDGDKYLGEGEYQILADYGKIINNTCDCSYGTNTGSCRNVDNNLVGYWDMDTMSGTLLKDMSGNGNNGTLSGTISSLGKIGEAKSFDGIDDQVILPKISYEDLTVMGWFYLKSDGSRGGIFQRRELSLPYNGFSLGKGANNDWGWNVNDVSGNSLVITTPQTLNEWIFLAGTYSSSEKKIRLFKNGLEVGNFTNPSFTNDFNFASQGELRFGCRDNLNYFNGYIDDIHIYNRTLSDTEISDYYNYSSNATGYSLFKKLTKPNSVDTCIIWNNDVFSSCYGLVDISGGPTSWENVTLRAGKYMISHYAKNMGPTACTLTGLPGKQHIVSSDGKGYDFTFPYSVGTTLTKITNIFTVPMTGTFNIWIYQSPGVYTPLVCDDNTYFEKMELWKRN